MKNAHPLVRGILQKQVFELLEPLTAQNRLQQQENVLPFT